jgi:hypothetical protein
MPPASREGDQGRRKAKASALVHALPRSRPSSGGERFLTFSADYIRQSKGRWAGRPLAQEGFQRDFANELFRTDRLGRRIYREALWGLPRKNGKSTSGAALGLYLLVADEEPGAEVYAAASSRMQAGVVFEEARQMVEASPVLSDALVVRRNHIEYPEINGIFRALAADAPRQHGLNPSGVVIDELHAHKNPELYYALTTGSAAREEPLVISITTAGYDRSSICWDVFQRGLSGEEPDFLFWWLGAREEADWSDPSLWKACNPASWVTADYLETEWRRLPPAVFARLHLNTWTEAEELWLPVGAWGELGGEVIIPEKAPIYVGVDIGLRHDTSAVAIVHEDEAGLFHVSVRVFDPPGDGHKLNLLAVENYLLELADRYQVMEVAYDPHFFQRSAEVLEDRLNMAEWGPDPRPPRPGRSRPGDRARLARHEGAQPVAHRRPGGDDHGALAGIGSGGHRAAGRMADPVTTPDPVTLRP